MANDPPFLVISHEMHVAQPQPETVIPVAHGQWKRLMDRIENCGEHLDFHQALGWTCVGFAASALLTAITLPASVSFSFPLASGGTAANLPAIVTLVSCIGLALAGGGIAFNSLWYARKTAQHGQRLRSVIVEDMQAIATAYQIGASQASQVPAIASDEFSATKP